MIGLLSSIGAWLSGFDLKRIAQYAFVGVLCFSAGNFVATERALRVQVDAAARDKQATLDRAARDQAEVSKALFNWKKKDDRRVIADAAHAHSADDKVHETLSVAAHAADHTSAKALAQLEKERQINEGLRNVNQMLVAGMGDPAPAPVSVCGFSADARRVLDQASGAVDEGDSGGTIGAAQANAAGGAVAAVEAAATSADGLSCDQLYRGFVALSADDRYARSIAEGWQAFWRERFAD